MPAFSAADIHGCFVDAFNRGDGAALAALYEPDAVLIIGGREIHGRENIRTSLENLAAAGRRMTLETRSVIVSQAGVAVLHGAWAIESGPDAGPDMATRGLSTEVVREQPDGTWLFVIDNPYTPEPSYG